MTVIREASFPSDLTTVRTLFGEYAAALDIDLGFQGFDAELSGLPGRYARPAGGVWLATAGDVAAGCVALRPLNGGVCEVKRLYVRPAHRGGGLGRRLGEQAVAAAAAIGYRRVVLDTLASMAGAVALYRSLGFTLVEPYYDNPVPGAMFFGRDLPP